MEILGLFKSQIRKRLLTLFFTNPEERYYTRQLVNLFNVSVGSLHRELKRLENSGILRTEQEGNLIFYKLNKNHSLFKEIKNIVFKTIGIQGALKEILKKINGVKVAFIYGSFAQSKEISESDIDLMIIGDIDEDGFITKIDNLEKRLQREINYIIYSKNEFLRKKKKKDSFILNIIKRPKIMLKGNLNEL
jgi:predicted nucleotidyltransferase